MNNGKFLDTDRWTDNLKTWHCPPTIVGGRHKNISLKGLQDDIRSLAWKDLAHDITTNLRCRFCREEQERTTEVQCPWVHWHAMANQMTGVSCLYTTQNCSLLRLPCLPSPSSPAPTSSSSSPHYKCTTEVEVEQGLTSHQTHYMPTQPSIPPGSVNEYQLRLGRQRQVWFIPLVDVRGVCR